MPGRAWPLLRSPAPAAHTIPPVPRRHGQEKRLAHLPAAMLSFRACPIGLLGALILLALTVPLADAQVSSLFGPSTVLESPSSAGLFGGDDDGDLNSSSMYEVTYWTTDPTSPRSDSFDPFASPTSPASSLSGPRSSPSSPDTPSPPRSYRAHLVYTDHTPSGWEYRTTTTTVRWTPSFENLHLATSSSTGMDGTALDYALLLGIVAVLILATCCVVVTAWCCSTLRENKVTMNQVYRRVWAMRPGRASQWNSVPVNTEEL